MATTKEIRISQLPLEKDIRGMMTVGVNSANQSVRVPLGEVINEEISKVKRTYNYARIDALAVGSSADDVASALIAENESKRTMPNVGDILVDWGGVIRVPVVRQTVQTGGEKPIYSFSFRTADNTATKTVTIQGFLYEPQTVVSVETVKDVTQQQISTLDTQLAEEATARLNQDDVLEAKITEEKNARTEADTAINAEIATVKDSVVGKKSKTWNGFAEVFNNIDKNKATADCAHAEGTQTTASEQAAHAEGKLTVASKPYAHAEGDQTQATSSSSHSEGFGTRASGYASHAEGGSTVASGNFTHAGGEHTKATNYAEQAIGYYNKSTYVNNNGQWKGDSESTLFSIGNGTSESDRKNALEVKQDGTVLVQNPGTKEMVKVQDGLMSSTDRAKLNSLGSSTSIIPARVDTYKSLRVLSNKILPTDSVVLYRKIRARRHSNTSPSHSFGIHKWNVKRWVKLDTITNYPGNSQVDQISPITEYISHGGGIGENHIKIKIKIYEETFDFLQFIERYFAYTEQVDGSQIKCHIRNGNQPKVFTLPDEKGKQIKTKSFLWGIQLYREENPITEILPFRVEITVQRRVDNSANIICKLGK